jgi:hypothetical protein
VLRHLRSHAHPYAVRTHLISSCVGYFLAKKLLPFECI